MMGGGEIFGAGGAGGAKGVGSAHFVYQRVHTLAGRALHLPWHLDLATRALDHIYGVRPELDEREIAARIAEKLRTEHYPARGSATVMLCFAPNEDASKCAVSVECERPLLDRGYAVSSLRPAAVTFEYSIPYGGWPMNFQLSAQALYDTLALRHGATRSVRREGDRLISCGAAPLFGIRGRELFTLPLIEGAMDSVERRLVIEAASSARLHFREEPIPHSELKDFDELFLADAAGITSLAECDGAKFMSLVVNRIVENFA